MAQKEKISVRLDLEGDLLKDFNILQEYFGIKSATDLLRFLIKSKVREIKKEYPNLGV